MTTKLAAAVLALAVPLLATPALSAEWTLNGEESKIAFGSVKNNDVGEVHHFTGLSGTVSEDGTAEIEIDVVGVETWIDIRNERMLKHVFESVTYPKATLTAKIDMEALEGLEPGQTTTTAAEGKIAMAGIESDVTAELFVAVLSEGRVMVTTDEMIMLYTSDLEIDAGIDALREIAGLDSIARVAPVTLRLIFENDDRGA